MIIRITSPRSDKAAKAMFERFRSEGYCPFGSEGFHMGFIKEATEDETGYVLTVSITNPSSIEYFNKLAERNKGG